MHYDEREEFLSNKKINNYFKLDEADHQYKTTARLKALIENNQEIKKNLSPVLAEY